MERGGRRDRTNRIRASFELGGKEFRVKISSLKHARRRKHERRGRKGTDKASRALPLVHAEVARRKATSNMITKNSNDLI